MLVAAILGTLVSCLIVASTETADSRGLVNWWRSL